MWREVKKEEILKSEQQSNILSEAPKIVEKASLISQQYNSSSALQTPQNEEDFTTLSKISKEDKIQIFKAGFRLVLEGKITFKKYYESKDSDSLFQLKGKRIRYESVRKNTLYKKLKDEFYTKKLKSSNN